MQFIKKYIRQIFKSLGFEIHKIIAIPWGAGDDFEQSFNEVNKNELISSGRCFLLWQLGRYASKKEGDVAEVGVYKGGSAKIISKICPNKKIHLFDTFSGMPQETTGVDLHKKGEFSDTSLDLVKTFLADCVNVVFHPGFFPATAATLNNAKFCFVHVDADIYPSVKSSLEFFYHKMVIGGIIVFDDYKWDMCPGVEKAVDEFFKDKAEKPIVIEKFQCMIIKI
jgi:hypothetical protein